MFGDQIVEKFCGTSTHNLKGYVIFLRFHSDGDIEGKGFKLSYEQHYGGDFTRIPVAMISSPLWPHLYPSNINAKWNIDGYEGTEFEIKNPKNLRSLLSFSIVILYFNSN